MRTGRKEKMFEDYNKKIIHLDTLTIPQVAEDIHVKDNDTAEKWLKSKGIKIHKHTKSRFVYQIEVASEIDKPFVLELRNQYPERWKELYRDIVKNSAVYNILVSKIESTSSPIPSVKARRINKKDQDRYKKFFR